MMQGVVNHRCEASMPLVVSNTKPQTQLINAVIDTGYTGFLSLPSEIIVTNDWRSHSPTLPKARSAVD